jgi:hypothetical protein
MNSELPRSAAAEVPARPRELWPAATLGTMMLLILMLSVHLVVISARLPGTDADTYADGTGSVATLGVARVAVGGD